MAEHNGAEGRQIKCPFCPMCGSEPPFIFDQMYQTFCPNDDCEVLMWVPWETAKVNLEDMHEIKTVEHKPHEKQN